jgi:hypothetical protein
LDRLKGKQAMRIYRTVGGLLLVMWAATTVVAAPAKGDPIPSQQSDDPSYGFDEKNPIKVGLGPENQIRFLESLRGPDGQKLKFKRLGSCCPYKSTNALFGDEVPLDKYEIKYRGLNEPIVMYLDFYDYEQPKIPVGFSRGK